MHSAPPAEPSRLTSGQRVRRSLAAVAGVTALMIGTMVGQDDHFPFGPFRMYSTTTSARVTVLIFEAVTTDGRQLELPASAFGLRPAEMNGQIGRFEPRLQDLLEVLVRSYELRHPREAPLQSLELAYGIHRLEDGRPVAYQEQALAAWAR